MARGVGRFVAPIRTCLLKKMRRNCRFEPAVRPRTGSGCIRCTGSPVRRYFASPVHTSGSNLRLPKNAREGRFVPAVRTSATGSPIRPTTVHVHLINTRGKLAYVLASLDGTTVTAWMILFLILGGARHGLCKDSELVFGSVIPPRRECPAFLVWLYGQSSPTRCPSLAGTGLVVAREYFL